VIAQGAIVPVAACYFAAVTMSPAFLALMADRTPALVVETEWNVSSRRKKMLAPVQHRLGGAASPAARKEIQRLLRHRMLAGMKAFYTKHDGAEICIDREYEDEPALLTLEPALRWAKLTARYTGKGEWAWTIDYCSRTKARSFYRGKHRWIVIATLEKGPACLTTFLDGPDAGKVFYLTPEPAWDILVPVAPSFSDLLDRMAQDLSLFFRRISVTVSRTSPRGEPWGLRPLAYLKNRRPKSVKQPRRANAIVRARPRASHR
jgi:hypothetical protein